MPSIQQVPTEMVPVGTLTPAPWNPRTLRDSRFKNLCASLESDPDFMWQRPILANANGIILAGNMRYRAALQLGWVEVPAIITDIPDRLAKERALKDNQQWGEWQEDELAALIYDLQQDGSQIDLLGFENKEIAHLLDIVGALGEKETSEPTQNKDTDIALIREHWGTEPGQIWEVDSVSAPGGIHRIICGSATDPAVLDRLFAGKQAMLMVTDPPYFVEYTGGGHGQSWDKAGDPAFKTTEKTWDTLASETDELECYTSFLGNALQHLHPKAPVYQWFASTHMGSVAKAWEANGMLFHQLLIWRKTMAVLTRSHFMWQHEPCIYGWKKGGQPDRDRRPTADSKTIWDVPNAREGDILHPTQKPVELFARSIRYHTMPREIVLDPFGGSGTCMLAAEDHQRIAYLVELQPEYTAVTLERMANKGCNARLVEE